MFNDKKINIESDNILKDYKILCKSRISSILGKKEVFQVEQNLVFLEMEKNWLKL